MYKISLVSRLHFLHPPEKWVWSTAYSIFIQMHQHSSALFFSNLMPDIIEDCIPRCVPTIYQRNIDDQTTLAATYRLGYYIFQKEYK